MSEFVFYRMKSQVARALNLPDLPYPARADRVNEIFGGEAVAMDKLLEDLDIFLLENPKLRPHYAEALGHLAYMAGVNASKEGSHSAALHYFELGLSAVPENLTLRANYAVTLHCLDRENEALAQYESIFSDPDKRILPMVWLLAARIYAKRCQYVNAYWLLRDCVPLLPGEERFRAFQKEMQVKAGMPDEGASETSIPTSDSATATPMGNAPVAHWAATAAVDSASPIGAPAAPTCWNCKSTLSAGSESCSYCGAPAKEPPPAPPPHPAAAMVCPRCGNQPKAGMKFCEKCGAALEQSPFVPPPPPAATTCPRCGAPLKPGMLFCASCGAKLG
jgi:hypothetical protein